MVLEPTSLNPAYRGSTEEGLVNALTIRSLAHYDSESKLVPHLANRAPVFVKNNLLFEIREDAKWDDGASVTCEDFQTGMLAVSKFRPSKSPKIEKIEWDALNPKKCKIKFNIKKQIYTLFMAPPLPTHIEKPIIESSQNEIDYLKNTVYATKPTTPGLANGPYKLSVYKAGYYYEFVRNPLFYGHVGPYEKLQFRFFKDMQSMINAYRTGEIDMIINGFSASRIEEVQKIITDEKRNSVVQTNPTTKLTHLEFNLARPAVSDTRVRRALTLLIDPKELAVIVGKDGQLTGSLSFYNDPLFLKEYEAPTYSMNRKKAMAFLKQAGYQLNSKNILVDSKKKPLEINLVYNSESLDRERVAVYLENKWGSIGITVHLIKYLKRVLFGEILKKGTFDVVVFGWSQPKLQINVSFFHSESIPNEGNSWIGSNFSRWQNPKAGKALKQADSEYEVAKIKAQLLIFQKEFRQDLPWLPLYFETRSVLVPSELKKFRIFPDWEPEVYEIERWLE